MIYYDLLKVNVSVTGHFVQL